MAQRAEILKGTLDLIILRALAGAPLHGFGITQSIKKNSGSVLDVDDGALYPALHRLEDRGWIASKWGRSDKNRRAKYYRLTARGRRQLKSELAAWERFSRAMESIIKADEQHA